MNYDFFDYKYNIFGYSGQDFESVIRILYLIISIFLCPVLAEITRKKGVKTAERIFRFLSVYLIIEEIFKISWESYWDITTGQGFNAGGILPLDTCSIFLYVLPIAAFGKGKAKRCALSWMSTIGVLGGICYLIFPMVLKWYPLFTFGAWHSLMYHFVMVYAGFTVISTNMLEVKRTDYLLGFIPHMLMALIVIPFDYHFGWDYMLLRNASGVPFVENLASKLSAMNLNYLTTVIMLGFYLVIAILFNFININIQKKLNDHGYVHHKHELKYTN